MDYGAAVINFLEKWFWRPVADESVYYNPFNTAAYAGLFALAAAYLGKPLMQKMDVEPDREFFAAVAPFVLFGGVLRSLKDLDVVNSLALETPFIYVLMFGAVSASIASGKKIERHTGTSYWKITCSIGSLMLLAALSAISYGGFLPLGSVVLLTGALSALTFAAFSKASESPLWISVPISSHWFDASTSIVALSQGANEKHVLARAFVETFGLTGMVLVKALLVVPSVYYIEKNVEGFDRKYYLFLIAVLGAALGTRNLISTIGT